MKDFYEELWERLPSDLAPPELELRRGFLLGELRPGDRVLDLGCGEGWFTAFIAAAQAPVASVIGIDVANAALARARAAHPDLDFRLAGIDAPLPLPDGAVDLVWASEVIEHVADTARWLSEVRRVLAPRGRLLLTTPNHSRLRLARHGIERYSEPLGDHLHLYSGRSLRTLLDDFSFANVEIHAAGGPPLYRRLLLARAER